MKADLERELGTFSLNCTKCGLDMALGQWSRRLTGALGASGAGPHGTDLLGLSTDAKVPLQPMPRYPNWLTVAA